MKTLRSLCLSKTMTSRAKKGQQMAWNSLWLVSVLRLHWSSLSLIEKRSQPLFPRTFSFSCTFISLSTLGEQQNRFWRLRRKVDKNEDVNQKQCFVYRNATSFVPKTCKKRWITVSVSHLFGMRHILHLWDNAEAVYMGATLACGKHRMNTSVLCPFQRGERCGIEWTLLF